ncbi:MAG: DUF3310 domain-containing protein [Gammaproteobacteria bacterium]|nr:DUF3310 domain-containing protein [Gammaproteobacteria bacterium]
MSEYKICFIKGDEVLRTVKATCLEGIKASDVQGKKRVEVYETVSRKEYHVATIVGSISLNFWKSKLATPDLPSDEKDNLAINPGHYQGYIADMQWWETEQYLAKDFQSVSLNQVRKYIARVGKKDDELQELLKAKWYLDFQIAKMINNNEPIRVADVQSLIASYKV